MSEPDDTKTANGILPPSPDMAQILIRAPSDIERLLNEFVKRKMPLAARFSNAAHSFVTHLRHVDPAHEFILVECSADAAIDTMLLGLHVVTFGVVRGGDRIDFIAAKPSDSAFDGERCLRFDYPKTMMLNRRRVQSRTPVVPPLPVRCLADAGGILSFECDIVDISQGGIGTMIYDQAILLQPGTILKGCKIFHGSETIDIDMEVRYGVAATLPDGRSVQRTGFRFCGSANQLDALVNLFAQKIEDAANDTKK
jgi:c-di-GMP-binding flagellar brake protein YcgR